MFSPPLDLSGYGALELELLADGRRYKLAVACRDGLAGVTELIPGGLRWVAEFDTEPAGRISRVRIPLASLRPSVRARPLGLPLRFDASRITRLQILHSRFAGDGGSNEGSGPARSTWRSARFSPWPEGGMNTDLAQLVAAAADLCRKPLRHAVLWIEPAEPPQPWQQLDDCSLRLQVRSAAGVRQPQDDLELELYRSAGDLNLTLAWREEEERPMLWHGNHPVWMDAEGLRCERPEGGLPLEALARRLRALLH